MSTRTFTFSVQAPGASVLAQNAAATGSRSWRQVSPIPSGLAAALTDIYSNRSILSYKNSGQWNPVSKTIEVIGGDHGGDAFKHATYSEATNSWSRVSISAFPNSHAYDLYDINPVTGDLWYKQYQDGSIPVWKKPVGGAWTLLNTQVGGGITGPCFWWGGATFAGRSSAQGWFMHQQVNFGSGTLHFWTPDGTHDSIAPSTPGNTIQGWSGVGAYSSTYNCAVWGGIFNGTSMTQAVWRLNADGTTTRLADTPAGMQLGGWGAGGYVGYMVCDPVTGKFVCLSGGFWWELDPTVGSWVKITTASSIPPAPYNVVDESNGAFRSLIELPEHGCIAAVHCYGPTASMYLYKHG